MHWRLAWMPTLLPLQHLHVMATCTRSVSDLSSCPEISGLYHILNSLARLCVACGLQNYFSLRWLKRRDVSYRNETVPLPMEWGHSTALPDVTPATPPTPLPTPLPTPMPQDAGLLQYQQWLDDTRQAYQRPVLLLAAPAFFQGPKKTVPPHSPPPCPLPSSRPYDHTGSPQPNGTSSILWAVAKLEVGPSPHSQ